MHFVFTVTCMLILCGNLSSQGYFESYYDSGRNEFSTDITVFDNGNLAITGFGREGGTFHGFYLMVDGSTVPTFNYLNSPLRSSLRALARNSENAAYMGGVNTSSGSRENWLLYALNDAGIITPLVSLGASFDDDELWGVIPLENGGFASCGGLGTQSLASLISFDAAGNERWQAGFRNSTSSFTIFLNVRESDTDLIVAGVKDEGNRNRDWSPLIVRYRTDGSIAWSFEYNLPIGEFIVTSSTPLVVTAEGDIVVAFVANDNDGFSTLLLKLTAEGALIWSKKIIAAGDLAGLDLLDVGDGALILGGYHRQSVEESAGFLIGLDAAGTIDWAKRYAAGQSTQIKSLSQHLSGDGLYAAGSSIPCGGTEGDVYLLSVDLEGNGLPQGCVSANLDFTIADYPVTRRPVGQQRNLSMPVAPMIDFREESGSLLQPVCVYLDLDLDDNSGATGPNFQFDLGCSDVPVPLHDLDLVFEGTFAGVDSLVIELVESAPSDSLFLIMGSPFVVNEQEQGRISFTNLGQLTNDEARQLLQAIRFLGTQGEAQQRRVVISLFSSCGEEVLAEAVYSISDEEMLTLDIGPDVSICQSGETRLDASSAGAFTYQWSTGADTTFITVDASGDYAVTVTTFCGNTLADTVRVTLASTQLVVLDTLITYELCFGDSIELDAATEGADRYLWSDGQMTDRRSTDQPGQLEVLVANACDTVRISYQISFAECCELYFPNAFSPNGDGVNDRFRPLFALSGCAAITSTSLMVYDRWGGLVFEGDGAQEVWDGQVAGKPAGGGTYAYVFRYFNGMEMLQRSGNIMLLR